MITFWPPAWHAAQLALKTCSPAPTSPAKAGVVAMNAAAPAPAAALATYSPRQSQDADVQRANYR